MSKNLGGRPVVHGLKAITGHRIRQARLAFASGKSSLSSLILSSKLIIFYKYHTK